MVLYILTFIFLDSRWDGGYDKCIHNFGWKRDGKKYSEDLDVDGRIILKQTLLLEKCGGR
jgi:hypothetical protein